MSLDSKSVNNSLRKRTVIIYSDFTTNLLALENKTANSHIVHPV